MGGVRRRRPVNGSKGKGEMELEREARSIKTRIMIVEDHASLQRVLQAALNMQKDFTCCGCAASGEEALRLVEELAPALVLADLSLPGMNGIELIERLKRERPDLLCAIYSGHDEPDYAMQALRAGANGYIVKGDPFDMIRGVRQIIAGEVYVSKRVAGAQG